MAEPAGDYVGVPGYKAKSRPVLAIYIFVYVCMGPLGPKSKLNEPSTSKKRHPKAKSPPPVSGLPRGDPSRGR